MAPEVSKFQYELGVQASVFIGLFDSRETQMKKLVGELQKISEEVGKVHQNTNTVRNAGAVAAGVGLGVVAVGAGIALAPCTGGLSLATTAGKVAVGGGVAVGCGTCAVVGANIYEMIKEHGYAEKVSLFMSTVEPLKKKLEDIQKACGELQRMKLDTQAQITLTEIEAFPKIKQEIAVCGLEWSEDLLKTFKLVVKLNKMNAEASDILTAVLKLMGCLITLIGKILSFTATHEEQMKFRSLIKQSADQGQRVIDACQEMKKELSLLV